MLATLVNPGVPIPPFITVLTGITQAMLMPAPPIEQVLPSFLEFITDAVLVAHNAPYDVGFLKAACAKHGYRWPNPRVLDTAALARRVLTRDEVPNRKLGTLAAYFRTATQPTHRALDDAKATVDVLHGLIARLGGHRVDTVGDAIEFARAVTPTQRRKRHLAEGLPKAPGVYIFRAADDRPLYVGTSGDIATRVRSYFTAAEKRARISEMLAAAERVEAVECAHSLEAEVRELRLIGAHAPPYNRRSKFPERVLWLKLTDGPYPGCRWSGPSPPATPPTSGRSAPVGRRSWPPPVSTTPCRCASAPTGSRCARSRRPARWPSWVAARHPASTGSPPRSTTPARSRRSAPPPPATRSGWSTPCSPGSTRSRTPSATRRRRWPGPGWRRCCGRPCGCNG